MSDYLTPAELHALTGRKQRPAQIAWLREKRWRHTVTASGDPLVARAYWHRRLVEDAEKPETPEPTFAALRAKRAAA